MDQFDELRDHHPTRIGRTVGAILKERARATAELPAVTRRPPIGPSLVHGNADTTPPATHAGADHP
jgi:hypothetical protein